MTEPGTNSAPKFGDMLLLRAKARLALNNPELPLVFLLFTSGPRDADGAKVIVPPDFKFDFACAEINGRKLERRTGESLEAFENRLVRSLLISEPPIILLFSAKPMPGNA